MLTTVLLVVFVVAVLLLAGVLVGRQAQSRERGHDKEALSVIPRHLVTLMPDTGAPARPEPECLAGFTSS